MSFKDTLRLARQNMRLHPTGTGLCTLGVLIGTACVVLLLSVGWSGCRQFSLLLESNPNLTSIRVYPAQGSGSLTEGDISNLAALPGVSAASPVLEIPARIRVGRLKAAVSLFGADTEALSFEFSAGRPFNPESDLIELIVGSRASENFATASMPDGGSELDETPEIDWSEAAPEVQAGYGLPDQPEGRRYKAVVCGILSEDSGGDPYAIYISPASAQRIAKENRKLMNDGGDRVRGYGSAVLLADSLDDVPGIAEEIRALGFEVYAESEYVMQMRKEQTRQQLQLAAFGTSMLVVSALGIANMMYASVTERRREIGIMRVLGVSGKEIRSLFLTEACLIGGAGALAGLAVSGGIILAVNTAAENSGLFGMEFTQGIRISIPFWIGAGAVALGIGTAAAAGLLPASAAAKLTTLQAIRRRD